MKTYCFIFNEDFLNTFIKKMFFSGFCLMEKWWKTQGGKKSKKKAKRTFALLTQGEYEKVLRYLI